MNILSSVSLSGSSSVGRDRHSSGYSCTSVIFRHPMSTVVSLVYGTVSPPLGVGGVSGVSFSRPGT